MRKGNYVPDAGMDYDPDSHHECTIFAATVIRQVCGLSVLAVLSNPNLVNEQNLLFLSIYISCLSNLVQARANAQAIMTTKV